MSRRQARKRILRALYQWDLTGSVDESSLPDDAYAREVVEGVRVHQDEIDRTIERRTEGWPLTRLHTVDRNLLRMAVYEILYREDVPPEVVINEAVELAKTYGAEKSPSFINGILDRIWKASSRFETQRSQCEGDSSEP